MATELGKRLLAEVEEVGLDEILQTIRLRHNPQPIHFGIPSLDKLVNTANSTKSNPSTTPPIVELISQSTGSGTTHFLYLLIAIAITPSINGGLNACVAILDTDNTFSVPRLVQQLRLTLPPKSPPSSIATALSHVHIFAPQSLSSLTATLESLPTYFLSTFHPSSHRPLAFIALDSLTAFHWQTKAAEADRAFEKQHPPPSSSPTTNPPPPPHQPKQQNLPTALHTTLSALSTSLIFTTHSLTNSTKNTSTQAPIPSPLTPRPTIRLSFSRRPVRSFPPQISIVEAQREASDRQRAIDAAGWEVDVVEQRGAEQRELRGMGFGFKITREGVKLSED